MNGGMPWIRAAGIRAVSASAAAADEVERDFLRSVAAPPGSQLPGVPGEGDVTVALGRVRGAAFVEGEDADVTVDGSVRVEIRRRAGASN